MNSLCVELLDWWGMIVRNLKRFVLSKVFVRTLRDIESVVFSNSVRKKSNLSLIHVSR